MEKAHKLHPRAAGPFSVRRVINPNAYDIAIPPEWGISSTFNIGDLVAYQGPLEVPPKPGLPHNSTESSLFAPEENNGDHSPPRNVATNGPEPVTEPEASAGSEQELEAVEAQKGRPRRPAKPTTRPSECVYFRPFLQNYVLVIRPTSHCLLILELFSSRSFNTVPKSCQFRRRDLSRSFSPTFFTLYCWEVSDGSGCWFGAVDHGIVLIAGHVCGYRARSFSMFPCRTRFSLHACSRYFVHFLVWSLVLSILVLVPS